jgi:enamine deaminase RidA (YjgF/YER057c/UK114 family)
MKKMITFAALAATCMLGTAFAQEHTREYVIDDRGRQRAFSRAVATTGGKTIWLAGQTTTTDANGNSLAGDFEGQTREIFRILDERLRGFGGDLSDIVTMTVYISDTRFGDPFVDIRSEHFDNDEYPSSALITVVGFARPDILIEIKATAVVDAD